MQVPEGQGMLATEELEDSDFDDILFGLPMPKPLVVRFPQPTPRHHITWLEQCRKTIEDHGEPLNKPFSDISEVLQCTLEDAEKTCGGPKGILAKVSKLAQNAYVWQVSAVFRDCDEDQETGVERQDGSGKEDSQDLLECVHRMVLIEARIRKSLNTESQASKNQKKTVLKTRTLSKAPPGGLLETTGIPGKSLPAMTSLCIKHYSNALYW